MWPFKKKPPKAVVPERKLGHFQRVGSPPSAVKPIARQTQTDPHTDPGFPFMTAALLHQQMEPAQHHRPFHDAGVHESPRHEPQAEAPDHSSHHHSHSDHSYGSSHDSGHSSHDSGGGGYDSGGGGDSGGGCGCD